MVCDLFNITHGVTFTWQHPVHGFNFIYLGGPHGFLITAPVHPPPSRAYKWDGP